MSQSSVGFLPNCGTMSVVPCQILLGILAARAISTDVLVLLLNQFSLHNLTNLELLQNA